MILFLMTIKFKKELFEFCVIFKINLTSKFKFIFDRVTKLTNQYNKIKLKTF